MNQSGRQTSRISAVTNRGIHSSLNLEAGHTAVAQDLEIMAAAQAGSSAAFDEFQRLYSHKLFATIFRITKNREDAEDALQDTFLRAYVALGCFQGRSSIYSWLTRIATNSALTILRRRARSEMVYVSRFDDQDGYAPLEIEDGALNPEQVCTQRQQCTSLLRAIEGLEPKLRVPIQIQLTTKYSLKEIASTLNISLPAVKGRLHRARAHLAKRVSSQSGSNGHVTFASTNKDVAACAQNLEDPCTICD